MSKKFWNSDKILSISAMFISLCTLVVFVYQTNLIHKQQYMSVFPYLELGHQGTNTKQYTYLLKNTGIGPAMIKSIQTTYKDSILNIDLARYVQGAVQEKDSIGFYHSNIAKGQLIPVGDVIKIIETYDEKRISSTILSRIIKDEHLNFIIEYESIYGERWRLSQEDRVPVKIK